MLTKRILVALRANLVQFFQIRPSDKLFDDAFVYLGANILNASVPFLLLPILTRILTPTDYGIVSMFTLSVTIMGAFTGLSVHGVIAVRYFQMESNELANYIGVCIIILLLSTTTMFLLVMLVGEQLSSFFVLSTIWLLLLCQITS